MDVCRSNFHVYFAKFIIIKIGSLFCRNQDFQEVHVEVNGEVVLKFALAYGFRNIQNIVQKIKRRKMQYHFVEIMACPSGNLL